MKRWLGVALLLGMLAGCRDRGEELVPATPAGDAAAIDATAARPPVQAPVIAAHYFGKHWPKNFIAAFRREEVARDFAALRADGFNTVVLLVSWGDFQPVFDPCCRDDERAWERLHFLLDQARAAGLQVMLRVGYAWTFHPDAGDSGARVHRLMNEEVARAGFLKYVERLGRELQRHPQVVMGFMSWEDQWLRSIDETARSSFEDYASLLPAGVRPPATAPLPRLDDASAALFHAYWDWLVIQRLLLPAQAHLSPLSYEARIDKEPQWQVAADGSRTVSDWLDHRGMLRQPGNAPVTIYWAPFWGAQNQGEVLAAERSLSLLASLLAETRAQVGERAIFIDQFNFVDNTPGYERNASLDPAQVAPFLAQAVCTMKDHGVIGYGLWTVRDYHESPLYNPAFGYGLDGWQLQRAGDDDPAAALRSLPSGDLELALAGGDVLVQEVGTIFGRLPSEDARADEVCVEAAADADSTLEVSAGAGVPSVALRFAKGSTSRQCAAIVARPTEGRLALRLVAVPGAALRLRDVWLHDHVQFGGLYDANGRPGPHLAAVQAMNRDFTQHAPAQCAR